MITGLADLAGAAREFGQVVATDQTDARSEIGERQQDRDPDEEEANRGAHRFSLTVSATSLSLTSNAASLNNGGPISIGGSLLNP